MARMITVFFLFCYLMSSAQNSKIVSGPMIGHVELRTAIIWMQFTPDVSDASVAYVKKGEFRENGERSFFHLSGGMDRVYKGEMGLFNIGTVQLINLEPGTTYSYWIYANKKQEAIATGEVTTQQLWQWRRPAPDFSFLTGSCAYFNQPAYDRPGTPYGSDSVIFEAMAKEKADFMLWLGDNWYTREVDFFSAYGLYYRPSRDRATKVLQPLLKAMPQYAIWDDHDYGWDNSEKSFPLKETSRKVFSTYWCNPSYGENGEGIYTRITWNDVDIFMLDDRWFRSNDAMKDSINGQPNPGKRMYGPQQMEWLKNALLQSNENGDISFRIIATGSQVLNSMSPKDCFYHYPAEFNELMQFLRDNNINGVVFLTGDRHHSEIIKTERSGTYPLYDITASSFTAGISKTTGAEKTNPNRVTPEIDEHNYARISFSGEKQKRVMKVEFMNIKGEKLADWSIGLDVISNR